MLRRVVPLISALPQYRLAASNVGVGAIALYAEFVRFLPRELDVRPSGETQSLARSLRDRQRVV